MLKRTLLAQAVALAIVLPGVSYAEFEISGEAKIEYDLFTSGGTVTGASEEHSSGDALKSEYGVKLFINSDIGESSAFHAELLLADDGEAASDRLEGGEEYTQYEILREFYFDTNAAGWDFRLGKQQVVWGTADGIKLLDIINPTDYREINQNVSEDSRIPIWMINAEKYFDNGNSVQFLITEAKPNFIAGLDADGDSGAPFIFKGVDTITGETNGFLNIARDMGKTSGVFQTLLAMGGLTNLNQGPMALTTVSQFTVLGTGGMNKTFSQVGQGLSTAGAFDLDGDGFNETVRNVLLTDGSTVPNNQVSTPTAPTAFQFAGPIQTDPNLALLNVVFLPFMNQLQTGNVVLDMASNSAGDLLGTPTSGFIGYMGQLETAFVGGVGIDFDGDTVDDISNAEIGTALNELGSQMYSAVAGGMGLDPTDPATALAIATAFGINPPTANPADADTIAFNNAIKGAAITGMGQTFFSNSTTNQFTGTLDVANPTSAFDYMGNTTFGTFDAFIGMKTDYRNVHDDETNQNLGFRFKGSTESGTNYSLNYAYRYDGNPVVDLHWEDSTGDTLTVNKMVSSMDALGQPLDFNGDGVADSPNPEAYTVTTLFLTKSDGSVFSSQSGANPATLVFEESLNQVSTLGASFDTALDGTSIPTVIRGEFSHDVGTKQPVINLDELSIGNLTEALKMEDADMFKYVLGVDLTVATNMLVSTQLIQFYNLDYIDEDNRRYTGDFSSMHLTNGMNKGDEVETFVSFFLSKPFGPDVQHRWNNIIIWENEGGYWNRFDVEYSFNDEMVGTIEYNKYWGDENTTFGQFEASSNLQLGFKYIF